MLTTFNALALDLGVTNTPTINDQQQKVVVTGTIVDATNNPMAGVNVLEKGTTNGVMAGIDGKYSITVSSQKSVLVFSFVGYELQEVTVGTQAVINVTLQETITGLNEVVVTGYGTARRRDVTGSIVSVNREEMLKKSPTNILQGLKGAAAGVMVTAQDGAPESRSAIRIRGVATINGSADPLYVVDGVQVGWNAYFLNPNDVESIEILKDASATAIYGAAGANGVIMITTKLVR
jgi:TonB-dependent SusC/RagA subfamily outer membrane receptor